jgi:hypothetical protein
VAIRGGRRRSKALSPGIEARYHAQTANDDPKAQCNRTRHRPHESGLKRVRKWLKGTFGDAIHAVLCGAGHNLRVISQKAATLLCPCASRFTQTSAALPVPRQRQHHAIRTIKARISNSAPFSEYQRWPPSKSNAAKIPHDYKSERRNAFASV